MELNKRIRLDLIRAGGGTQQREINEETMERYLTLMEEGIEFPAIELVFDGKVYWLWDGFHRYFCAQRRKLKVISANVTRGALRDAIWLSFSANKDHGLPRQKGVAKDIIERILADTTWARKSLSAIARHVGVTKQYVSQVKDELQSVEAKPPAQAKNDEKGSSTLPLSRSGRVKVQSSRGTTYTQKSQEKQHRLTEPPKDSVGRPIPEHLREVYLGRSVINGLITDVEKVKHFVEKAISERNPVFTMLNTTAFQAHCENLRRALKSTRPYAVCCYCGGDAKDCKACQGFGFLNEHTYRAAPKELQK